MNDASLAIQARETSTHVFFSDSSGSGVVEAESPLPAEVWTRQLSALGPWGTTWSNPSALQLPKIPYGTSANVSRVPGSPVTGPHVSRLRIFVSTSPSWWPTTTRARRKMERHPAQMFSGDAFLSTVSQLFARHLFMRPPGCRVPPDGSLRNRREQNRQQPIFLGREHLELDADGS